MSRRILTGVCALVLVAVLAAISGSDYVVRLFNLAAIAAIAVLGLNFALGYAGLISICQSVFVGLGAYCLAILTTRYGWPTLASVPAAIVGTTAVSILVGYPLLRVRGHYLALATLGLTVCFGIVLANWQEVTGGLDGISRIPGLAIAGREIAGERHFLFLAVSVLAVVASGSAIFQRTQQGRAMIAVRDDETAAAMSGVNVTGVKIAAFAVSAAYGALSGCLFALHVRFISPEDFGYMHSINYIAMLIVGGEGTVVGAILGATVVTFLPELMRGLGSAYLAFFGLLLLSILVFLPHGVVSLLQMLPRLGRAVRQLGRRGRQSTLERIQP